MGESETAAEGVKIRRGTEEFFAPDMGTLAVWAREGRIAPTDYVLHPLFGRWMYAREIEELHLVPPAPQFSPGVAAVLSLVIPGAGQMYRGDVGGGILLLIVTVIGYLLFIVPGLVMHLITVVLAAQPPK